MKIVALSDTHNLHDQIDVPKADVLVHAGDATGRGDLREVAAVGEWLRGLLTSGTVDHAVFVAGNHDFLFEHQPHIGRAIIEGAGAYYLQDEEVVIDGVKFYGAPWQPRFYDWAFNLDRGSPLRQVWEKIPEDTDVLITHGPPYGILDRTLGYRENPPENVGCEDLMRRIEVVKPKYHVFGHIHCNYGIETNGETVFVNASNCNERYRAVNKPLVFDLEK